MVAFSLVIVAEVCVGCDSIELSHVVLDHAKPLRGLAQLAEFCNGSLFVICCTEVCLEVGFKSHIICPGHCACTDLNNEWTGPYSGSFHQLVEDRDPTDLCIDTLYD